MRWDRLTLGIGLSYALLAWSTGFGALLPQLRDEVSMSASVASLHGSLFGIFLLVLATVGRPLLAAMSNRMLLVASVVGMFGGGLLFGLGRTAAITLLGAGLAGFGAACLIIVVPSVVFAHQQQAPIEAMAVLNTFPMLAATVLPAVVGLAVAADVTWRIAYLVPLIAITLGIAGAAGRAQVPSTRHAEPVGLADLFRVPEFARAWAGLACGVLVEIGTGIWAASIMVKQGGASNGVGALLTVGFFIGMGVGRLSLSRILRRHTDQSVIVASFLGVLVSLAPFLLGPGLAGRVTGLALVGVTLAAVYPLLISRLFELHHDTEALGRAAALASGVGVTFGPLLLGTLADLIGLGRATIVLPVFTIAGLWMIAGGRRNSPGRGGRTRSGAGAA